MTQVINCFLCTQNCGFLLLNDLNDRLVLLYHRHACHGLGKHGDGSVDVTAAGIRIEYVLDSSPIEMRINQLREEGAQEDIDLRPALLDYYTCHMKDGTFVSWIAVEDDRVIGTSGMSFVEKPPYYGCPSGKMGLLSSMYTNPDYRRKGIARELLRRVVEEARNYGCGTIQITASDMGVKLYSSFGFVHNGNFMQYKL